eukprot:1159713-Pelagomonas_calceolata.AAC.11
MSGGQAGHLCDDMPPKFLSALAQRHSEATPFAGDNLSILTCKLFSPPSVSPTKGMACSRSSSTCRIVQAVLIHPTTTRGSAHRVAHADAIHSTVQSSKLHRVVNACSVHPTATRGRTCNAGRAGR